MDDAAALDARILAAIDAYALDDAGFLALARDLFAYQIERNAPYAAYACSLGFDRARLPERVEDIPAVPAAAAPSRSRTACAPRSASNPPSGNLNTKRNYLGAPV